MTLSDKARRRAPATRRFACGASVLLLATLAQSSVVATDDGGSKRLAAALDDGDECAAESTDGACGLSALQLRAQQRHAERTVGGEARTLFEAAPSYQAGWTREGRAPGGAHHELVFIVERKGVKKVEEMLLDRSNPSSPNYGKWLSQAQVREIGRNEVGLQAVKSVLAGLGDVSIVSETPGGELVRARAPLATWESLLGTEFHELRHPEGGNARLYRALGYTLPPSLVGHAAGVLRVVELGDLQKGTWGIDGKEIAKSESTGGLGCGKDFRTVACSTFKELAAVKPVIDPSIIRRTYSMPEIAARGSTEAAEEGNVSQMVYASLSQYWSPSDRTKFEEELGIPQDQYVRQLDPVNGKSGDELCRHNLNGCLEANLDVQYMMAMSPWSKMGYYYMDKESTMYDFLFSFAEYMLASDNPPTVISISYGLPEIGASDSAVLMFDALAATLGLQGVTITAASGDDGAAGALARQQTNGACWLTKQVGLMATWPAVSPWVTAVGATMGPETGNAEVVCSVNATGPAMEATEDFPPLITSGGGYSQRLKRPKYQDGHHDQVGRGIPDISLAGHAYAIVVGGTWLTVDGTSASSPAFAGMVTLMNARRVAKGMPRLGFLNPLMYQSSMNSTYNDITEGDNKCASRGSPCCGGYEAGPGWDPTTGLGSLNFTKFSELSEKLDASGGAL